MQTETALVLELDNLRDSLAPLFHRYPREVNPQGAFVEITEEGAVSADWGRERTNRGRSIHSPAPKPERARINTVSLRSFPI